MKIIHKIDTILAKLFPRYKLSVVSINGDIISTDMVALTITSQKPDCRQVIACCEKVKYAAAKPILKNLIARNPDNSAYHRIMGQILTDEGEQEETINYLIDALRWNPKNGYG